MEKKKKNPYPDSMKSVNCPDSSLKQGTRITVPCFLLFSLRLMEALHFLAEFLPFQEN